MSKAEEIALAYLGIDENPQEDVKKILDAIHKEGKLVSEKLKNEYEASESRIEKLVWFGIFIFASLPYIFNSDNHNNTNNSTENHCNCNVQEEGAEIKPIGGQLEDSILE